MIHSVSWKQRMRQQGRVKRANAAKVEQKGTHLAAPPTHCFHPCRAANTCNVFQQLRKAWQTLTTELSTTYQVCRSNPRRSSEIRKSSKWDGGGTKSGPPVGKWDGGGTKSDPPTPKFIHVRASMQTYQRAANVLRLAKRVQSTKST